LPSGTKAKNWRKEAEMKNVEMKRTVAAVLVWALVCLLPPGVHAERFSRLELGPVKTISVPADAATIQAALDKAAPGDTIQVAAGEYQENLRIPHSLLKLKGAGAGTTTILGSGSDPTIEILYVKAVNISGLTVSHDASQPGVYAKSASAYLENTTLTGCRYGIRAEYNAHVELYGVQATSNTEAGARLSRGASGIVYGCSFGSNKDGLYVDRNASAYVIQSTFSGNTGTGVNAWMGGSITMEDCSLEYNGGNGFSVSGASNGMLYGGNYISDNDGAGISLTNSSFFTLYSDDEIRSNGNHGINVMGGSSLQLMGGKIHANDGSGVFLINGSSLFMKDGDIYTNDTDGVSLHNGSSAQFEAKGRIYNNSEYGIRCYSNFTSFTGSATFPNPPNGSGSTIGCGP
jgi:parallel beta-helix repeat protein